MEWLAEDEVWEQARQLLAKIPEELRTNTQFRRQRLMLLDKANLNKDELDAEWNALLHDFPEELSLHLHRYDLLREAKRVSEAHAVLNSVRPFDGSNPYYLARLVEVRAEEKKVDDAIEVMHRVFFAEAEASTWPVDYSWEALKKTLFLYRAYDEARCSLEKKQRPTPRAFFILCSYALENAKTEKKIPQSRWATWFPDRGVKELLRLLELADRCPWIDGSYRAKALDRLNRVGHYRLVVQYWKKRRADVESDVASWSETGRALASLKRKTDARSLLSSWRQQRGVGMWVVANYIGCLSPIWSADLKEILASCGDALRDLPHDHCARYLAHAKAEAHALLGDKQGLRQTWDQYRSYFDCNEKKEEWFEGTRKQLLTEIPVMIRYLEQNQLRLYRRAVWQLRWRHISGALGSRTRLTSRGLWWAWVILIWFLLQLLRVLDTTK